MPHKRLPNKKALDPFTLTLKLALKFAVILYTKTSLNLQRDVIPKLALGNDFPFIIVILKYMEMRPN